MARGFVPRGYSYLGPGNDLSRGPPRNANDALAEDHDRAYTAIIEAGGRPYSQWSEADRQFYDNLNVNDLATAAAKGLFGLKRTGHALGILGSVENSTRRGQMARGSLRGRQALPGETAFNRETERQTRERASARERQEAARQREIEERRTGLDGMIEEANNDAETSLANLPGGRPANGGHQATGPLRHGDNTLLDDMEVPGNDGENVGDAMVSFAAFGSGGSGPNGQSKETPVSNPPSITYGLQETHTTILPWNGWVSANLLDYGVAVKLPIRMNAPVDMIPITTQTDPATGAIYTVKGLYGSKASDVGTRSYIGFPANFASASTDPTERPSWREYFFQIYEFYTVLKCHYEIIVENPMKSANMPNNGILIGTQFDSYSDTAGSSGNVMPDTTLMETLQFKGMKWEKVDGQQTNEQQRSDNNRTVISGTWMPGMTKRNIINDGDVKTWTATTGAAPPNLKEILTVNFWRHPFAIVNTAGAAVTNCNIQINLKYVVQFKDLKLQARYPNTAAAAGFNITQLLNNSAATGQAYQQPLA